jgi:hypothetical protein
MKRRSIASRTTSDHPSAGEVTFPSRTLVGLVRFGFERSDARGVVHRPLVPQVAGIQGAGGFEQQDVALGVGDRPGLDFE